MNDAPPPEEHQHSHEEFSPGKFFLCIGITLVGLLCLLKFFAPATWSTQLAAPLWKGALVFAAISMLNCFIEFFFHRYVLHMPAIPFLRHFYKRHTLHHALTHIIKKRGFMVIENKFPILEPAQYEAAFFPWYTYTIFALIVAPLLALLQWVFPSYPWFFGGFLALASSLTLYEILHAINHWPIETFEPLINNPRWGWFWKPVYGFHLRHHAAIECNESISGFFGLPVADWVFGTCLIPETVYSEGEQWTAEKFRNPTPRLPIRLLDTWAKRSVAKRREQAAQTATGAVKTPGWITNTLGITVGVVALTLLTVFSSIRGDAWHIITFVVFGVTLLALYTVSTVYNNLPEGDSKRRWQKFQRIAILLLIAGTYTPFLLTQEHGSRAWTLFGVTWGLCGSAAAYLLLTKKQRPVVSTLITLAIGWTLVALAGPSLAKIPQGALWLLLAGGICYTLVAAFGKWRGSNNNYAIRQFFTLGGSACHVVAALVFFLPAATM